MNKKQSNITCITCSIFREELKALEKRGEGGLPTRFLHLDSMLHLRPSELHSLMESHLQKELEQGHQVLLLFGECHVFLHQQESLPGVERVKGINCPEILLGRRRYRSLRKQGVFFLMHEWVLRWKEIFQKQMGLNREIAKVFFPEMHSKILYLDTGLVAVPYRHLEAISRYAALPWEVAGVKLDHMATAIREAVKKLES